MIIVFNKFDLLNLLELIFYNLYGFKISVCVYLEGKWKCLWLVIFVKFNFNVDIIFYKLLDKLSFEKNVFRKKVSLMK